MSQYLRKMKRMFKQSRFGDLFPIREYWEAEGVFVCDGPALGAMIICQPTNGGSREIKNSLEHLYQIPFPNNTTIQYSLVSLPDIEDFQFGYRSMRGGRTKGGDEERLEAYAKTTHDFYRNSTLKPVNQRGFMFRNFENWISIKVPIADAMPTTREIEDFNELIKDVVSQLSFFGPHLANEVMWLRRMQVIFNIDDGEWMGKPSGDQTILMDRDLRDRVMKDGKYIEVKERGLDIYNDNNELSQHICTATISKFPDVLGYGILMDMVSDWRRGFEFMQQHFMLTLNLVFPEQLTEIKKLRSKRNFITTQAKGEVLKYLDKLRYQKFDLDEVMTEIEQKGSTLAKYAVQFTVFGQDREKAENTMKSAISYYKSKNIIAVRDSHFTMPNLISVIPFGMHHDYAKHSGKFSLGTSKSLPFLTPHMASWKGNTGYPIFQLASRTGQVVNIDIFISETNYNMAIAAASGAGKSFGVGYIINAYLNSGVKKQTHPDTPGKQSDYDDASQVFIFDVGHSYQGLAAQYEDSQYLEYGKDFGFSLNPFPTVVEMSGTEGQAGMIASIIKTMASPTGNITDYQNAEILRLLGELWDETGTHSTITDFQEKCLKHDNEQMNYIGKQLSPFCAGGTYEDLFSNKNPPVKYTNRLVVCEFDKVNDNKHLKLVVMMSAIMAIQKEMFLSGSGKRKLFVLEEAWEYISAADSDKMYEFFSGFLEQSWRRFRKTNSSGICVTQSINDYYTTSLGRAIMANSAWTIILRQKQDEIEQLKTGKLYTGSPMDFELMQSLRKVSPSEYSDEAFSEMIIRNDGVGDLCRLYADRRMQLILTTEPNEKEIRQGFMNKGMTLMEAIDAMMAQEGSA